MAQIKMRKGISLYVWLVRNDGRPSTVQYSQCWLSSALSKVVSPPTPNVTYLPAPGLV